MNDLNQFFIYFPLWTTLFSAILGLIIGSFLNVVIHRLPQMLWREVQQECQAFLQTQTDRDLSALPSLSTSHSVYNLWWPFSQCPHCEQSLKWYHNIPLLSFFIQKGRCAYCKTKINRRYPLIEILTTLFTVLTLQRFGLTAAMFGVLILGYGLIAAACIDIEHHLLPDSIILPLLWLGLILNTFHLFTSLHQAVLGAVLGYTSLRLFTTLYYWIRGKIGLGRGDMKCLALFGAWLGFSALPFILIFAAFTGIIGGIITLMYTKQDWQTQLAFGPYLIVAGLIAIFAYPAILEHSLTLLK